MLSPYHTPAQTLQFLSRLSVFSTLPLVLSTKQICDACLLFRTIPWCPLCTVINIQNTVLVAVESGEKMRLDLFPQGSYCL